MTDTTLQKDTARCPGRYDTLHGEFGSVANPQCIGCGRRVPVIHGDGMNKYLIDEAQKYRLYRLAVLGTCGLH